MINKHLLIAAVIGASITGAHAADPALCRPYAAVTAQAQVKRLWLQSYTACINADEVPPVEVPPDAAPIIDAMPPGEAPASGPLPVQKPVPKVAAGEPLCVKHGMKTVYNGKHWRCIK